jgi:CBS domain containing-hemolysin-like protein
MGSGDAPLILLAIVGALLAAGFGCIDAALTRVSRVSVDEAARAGRAGAERLAEIISDPARYLSLLLLLRIGCEMLSAACVAVLAVHWYGSGFAAVGLATLISTLVAYILVGVMFRTLGRQHAPAVAVATAGITAWLTRIFGPLPRLLIAFGNAVTPGPGYRDGPFATEAELRDLVDLAEEQDVIEPGERDMIASVFELGDTLVREVMVPRPDVVFIESTQTVVEGIELALRSGFSRIPVVGETVDDVVGVAFLKDMVGRDRDGRGADLLSASMRSPVFVPDSKPADDLLREMQSTRAHMAIVIDEYGGTAGLVTIEDILEEIVGEITDEYDRGGPPVEWISADVARVTARLPVDDLAELFGVDELPGAEDVDTVGGLLASALGRVPIPGATASVGGLALTAESAAGRRNQIGTVVVRREKPPGAPDEPGVGGRAGGGRRADAGEGEGDRVPATSKASKASTAPNTGSSGSGRHGSMSGRADRRE